MFAKESKFFLSCLLAAGLYFSGLTVIAAPLPLIFYLLSHHQKDFSKFYPFFLFSCVCFGAIFLAIHVFYPNYSGVSWFFIVSYNELIGIFSPHPVFIVDTLGFLFLLFVAARVYLSVFEPQNVFQTIQKTVLIGFGTMFAVFSLLFIIKLQTHSLQNIWQELVALFEKKMTAYIQLIQSQDPNVDMKNLFLLESNLTQNARLLIILQPVFLLINLTGLTLFNFAVAKRLFALRFPVLFFLALTRFQLPFHMVWFFVGALVSLIFSTRFFTQVEFIFISMNAFMAIAFLYVLQGFAVTVDFLNRKKIFGLLRTFIYLTLFLSAVYSVPLLLGFGLIDIWIDFRKINHTEIPPDQNLPKPPAPSSEVRDQKLVDQIWGKSNSDDSQ